MGPVPTQHRKEVGLLLIFSGSSRIKSQLNARDQIFDNTSPLNRLDDPVLVPREKWTLGLNLAGSPGL